MRKLVAYFLIALFAISAFSLGGYLVYDKVISPALNGNNGNDNEQDVSNDNEDESGDSNWMYPSISMTKEDASYWTDRYTKEGFRFFFGSNDRAGIATKDWLKKVQTEAKKYMKETERKGGDEAEFNDFVHNALKAREVAALEEYESGKSYPNGRDMYIFYDENGDTKVLPVNTDDVEFDFTDAEDPYSILSKPEETITGAQAQSLVDSLIAKYATKETVQETATNETVETPAQETVETPAQETTGARMPERGASQSAKQTSNPGSSKGARMPSR